MNLNTYYSILVIEPIEKEIKILKCRLNKKINIRRKSDQKKLTILKKDLLDYYKFFYQLKEKEIDLINK